MSRSVCQSPEPLIHTAANEGAGEISPDGHHLAYEARETASDPASTAQVYVRPFPNVNGGRWQISTEGGRYPAWTAGGKELVYLAPNCAMMSVAVGTAPTFDVGVPSELFRGSSFRGTRARAYDVTRDGQRFLLIKNDGSQSNGQSSAPLTMTVVLNWTQELKRLVPAK